MKEYKILVWNMETGSIWTITKKFSSNEQAHQYCMKRSGKMYMVSVIE